MTGLQQGPTKVKDVKDAGHELHEACSILLRFGVKPLPPQAVQEDEAAKKCSAKVMSIVATYAFLCILRNPSCRAGSSQAHAIGVVKIKFPRLVAGTRPMSSHGSCVFKTLAENWPPSDSGILPH